MSLYNRKKDKAQKSSSIELECTECSEINTVVLSSDIYCKKCNKSLGNKLYKSVVISAGLLLGAGGIAGALGDDILNINRPSVKTEFRMMVTCLNEFDNDEKGCVCAVESMSGLIDALKARSTTYRKRILEDRYEDCVD